MSEITQLLWESTGESWCIYLQELCRNFHTSRKYVAQSCGRWFVQLPIYAWIAASPSGLKCFFYNWVVLKVSFIFLQTATQAEEVRFITIHILLSPEITASATRWTHSLQMTKDWYKWTIFLCPPGWECIPLYLIGTGNIFFIESNSAPVFSLCMIILCHVIIYCTERWILCFACKNYWKLDVLC